MNDPTDRALKLARDELYRGASGQRPAEESFFRALCLIGCDIIDQELVARDKKDKKR